MAIGKVSWSFRDYAGQGSNASFYIAPQVGSAVDVDATIALTDTLRTAIVAIAGGNIYKETLVASLTNESIGGTPQVGERRENKWLLMYQDDTTLKKYTAEVPCADWTLITDESEFLDLSTGDGATLKAAFEAVAKSEVGNAVTLTHVKSVGRNT